MGQRFESQFSQVNFGPRMLSNMLITFKGIYTCIKLPPKAKKLVKWKINCEPHPYTVLGRMLWDAKECKSMLWNGVGYYDNVGCSGML